MDFQEFDGHMYTIYKEVDILHFLKQKAFGNMFKYLMSW